MFLRFLVLDLFQTSAKRHFTAFFSSVFQKSLPFFQQAKRRRRAKTLSPDPLMYHWFDVIWHHGVSTDFWSRIDMLWPSIIFEGLPCPVYNLSACQRGACTLSLKQFCVWIVFVWWETASTSKLQPLFPKPHFHLDILQLCFFQRFDPASRRLQVQWSRIT